MTTGILRRTVTIEIIVGDIGEHESNGRNGKYSPFDILVSGNQVYAWDEETVKEHPEHPKGWTNNGVHIRTHTDHGNSPTIPAVSVSSETLTYRARLARGRPVEFSILGFVPESIDATLAQADLRLQNRIRVAAPSPFGLHLFPTSFDKEHFLGQPKQESNGYRYKLMFLLETGETIDPCIDMVT
jgi:hypothetical protein